MNQDCMLIAISLCFIAFVCADDNTTGSCGDLKWSFDNNTKQLTITGSGEMKCSMGTWSALTKSIESVVFQGNVTIIQSHAFSFCTSLNSITIPSSVTEIGYRAFENCLSLTTITIPGNETLIHSEAFVGCERLSAIHVDSSNIYHESIDGVLFKKRPASILTYPAARRGDYIIPKGTKTINSFAFFGSVYLTAVTIPDTVTHVEQYAFSSCSSLETVSIPASVTSIKSDSFSWCSNLTWIEVDSDNQHYKSVDGVLFNKEGTKLVEYPGGMKGHYTIPSDVISIDGAFTGCVGLTSVIIPSSITSMSYSTFQGCANLEIVSYLGTSNPGNDVVFSQCDKLSAISVPLDYESSDFCGISDVCKTDSPDAVRVNYCFYAVCENNEIAMKKRDIAIEWEKRSNRCYEYKCMNESGLEYRKRDGIIDWEVKSLGCVEYYCDNESGTSQRFICISTNTTNRTCVNGECIESKANISWSLEIDFDGMTVSEFDITDISDFLDLKSLTCRVTADEDGYILSIEVLIDDEEAAESLLEKLEECQRAKEM